MQSMCSVMEIFEHMFKWWQTHAIYSLRQLAISKVDRIQAQIIAKHLSDFQDLSPWSQGLGDVMRQKFRFLKRVTRKLIHSFDAIHKFE